MKLRVFVPIILCSFGIGMMAAEAESTKKKSGAKSAGATPAPKGTPSAKTGGTSATPKAAESGGTKASTGSTSKSSAAKSKSKAKGTPEPEGSTGATPSPTKKSKSATKSGTSKNSPAPKSTPRPDGSAGETASKPDTAASPSSPQVETPSNRGGLQGPDVATLAPADLIEFDQQPEWLQRLMRDGLALSARNLGYLYGSAEPDRGGMDCSGTIYYLLRQQGFRDVPRDSTGQYEWLRNAGSLRRVQPRDVAVFDARALRPGDLLFWTGTYEIQREGSVTHVMLFLGTEKATGKPVMWGASDGRSYGGKQRYGVSVFDFRLPKPESKSNFVAFGQLPKP